MDKYQLKRIYIPLNKGQCDKLLEVAKKEKRDPRLQAALYVTEALELEEDENRDNLSVLKITLGNSAWLDDLVYEEVANIVNQILPMFEQYCIKARKLNFDGSRVTEDSLTERCKGCFDPTCDGYK